MEVLLYLLIGFGFGHLIGGHKYRVKCAELEETIIAFIEGRVRVRIEGEDNDEL